jgi:hypothetical protein
VDPVVVALPGGGLRMYYTWSGSEDDPAFSETPNEIRSAFSEDGTRWKREPGVRFHGPGMVDPDIVPLTDGGFRLYYTAATLVKPKDGTNEPGWVDVNVKSALSTDGLSFTSEPDIRLQHAGVSSTLQLPDGRTRMYFHTRADLHAGSFAPRPAARILSAISPDGLSFTLESGVRIDATPAPGRRFLGADSPSVMQQSDGSTWMLLSTVREPWFPVNALVGWWADHHPRDAP